jgi:hypothetical protein
LRADDLEKENWVSLRSLAAHSSCRGRVREEGKRPLKQGYFERRKGLKEEAIGLGN